MTILRRAMPLTVAALASASALAPSAARAEHDGFGEDGHAARFTSRDLVQGWTGLTNGWYVADVMIVLSVAALLGALLGYHPQVRRKAWSFEQLDQPKTFIMYALVGALSALVGREDKNMAYVIFGIGGLMRFRTDVGEAKDTGRVILATMIGVLVGLKLMPVALLATAFAWVLIFYLEKQRVDQVMIQGIDRQHISGSSEAYRQALARFGCRLVSERKNVMKGTIQLTFRSPVVLDRDALERHFEETIEREHRGSVDWEIR
jgi:uncharacterized membrane protein YhiD involved in acid resistance